MQTLYITGAGVSAESGIPTFRGTDGFWTIGSVNYTPQEMATRQMYLEKPDEFLLWYYQRFASYRDIRPNTVHQWLADKQLITQNIDGLDGKAGNPGYIPIHGRLDQVLRLAEQDQLQEPMQAPWADIAAAAEGLEEKAVKQILLDAFKIGRGGPENSVSLKPFVLLFDEYYTEQYRISEAESWMQTAEKMVFIGTSFSVNITNIALHHAVQSGAEIEIVDPQPARLQGLEARYHQMTAADYIDKALDGQALHG